MGWAEWLQSARSTVKVLPVLIGLVVVARCISMELGALAALALLPVSAMSLGMGMFSEEIDKGQWRYFAAWPVSRTRWGLIKTASIVICLAMMAVINALILWAWPGNEIEAMLLPLPLPDATLTRVLWAVAAYTLYAAAAGLLAMLMSESMKLAVIAAQVMLYLPGVVVLVMVTFFGVFPSVGAVATMLSVMGVVLSIGAWGLFMRRNPFVNETWVWSGFAATYFATAVSTGMVALPIGLSVFGIGALERVPFRVDVSPDGRTVLLYCTLGKTAAFETYVVRDPAVPPRLLDEQAMLADARWSWVGENRVILLKSDPANSMPDNTPTTEFWLHDLDSGEARQLPHDAFDPPPGMYSPSDYLLDSTNSTLTFFYYSGDDTPGLLRRIDLATSTWTDTVIERKGYGQLLQDGRMLLSDETGTRLWSPPDEPRNLDASDQHYVQLSPNKRWLIVNERELRDGHAYDRITAIDLRDDSRHVLLPEDALPPVPFEKLVRRENRYVAVQFVHDDDLAEMSATESMSMGYGADEPPSGHFWLIDMTGDEPVVTPAEGPLFTDESMRLIDRRGEQYLIDHAVYDKVTYDQTEHHLLVTRIANHRWQTLQTLTRPDNWDWQQASFLHDGSVLLVGFDREIGQMTMRLWHPTEDRLEPFEPVIDAETVKVPSVR